MSIKMDAILVTIQLDQAHAKYERLHFHYKIVNSKQILKLYIFSAKIDNFSQVIEEQKDRLIF